MKQQPQIQASGASETTRFFCTRISSAAGAAGELKQQHKKEANMSNKNANPSGATQTLPSCGLPATPRRQCRNRHKRILANMFDVDNCNTCDSGQCPAPMKKECNTHLQFRFLQKAELAAFTCKQLLAECFLKDDLT